MNIEIHNKVIRVIAAKIGEKNIIDYISKELKENSSQELIKTCTFQELIQEDGIKKIIQSCSFQNLGVDSLTSMEIVMAMEEEFNIEIPEEDAVKMTTVQAAIDFAIENFYKIADYIKTPRKVCSY